jgi:adenylate cyclase
VHYHYRSAVRQYFEWAFLQLEIRVTAGEAERTSRRLAAILVADIAGYAALMGANEDATVQALKGHQGVLLPLIAAHGGHVIDLAGDGILAEFPSVVGAVEAGIAMQAAMAERNTGVPVERRMQFRIGINHGDVVHDESRIYGDGINIAARLQSIAEPGGICISAKVLDEVRGRIDAGFTDLGEQTLKNIERPVRVYRVTPGRQTARPEPAGPALPDRPSIAVLPFDNMTVDPAQEFFADGITEDITTALSKLKGFFVIARNTMFTYKGKAVDVRTLGRELGVRYLLEGSVRKSGDRIRVTAQLIDAATGSHLWGDRYDRNLDDIFVIQDEITTSVVGRIGPELLAAEHARASRKPPENLDAWECTIRALFLSSRLSEEASREALTLIDRAIRSDPDYAQALGLKSWIVVWRSIQGWDDMARALEEAKSASARALAANEEEPWAWLGQGCVGIAARDDADFTISAMAQAVQLNPNFALAHGLLGNAYAFAGRSAEALASIDRAVRLSPREVFQGAFAQQYAFAYFQAANYRLGLEFAQKAHQLRPGHSYPMVVGAACAGHLGDVRSSVPLVKDLKTALPTISAAWVESTAPYVLAEDRQRLIEGLARAGAFQV